MSAPPFRITLSDKVNKWAKGAKSDPQLKRKYDKFVKAVRNLKEVGPRHPGLCTHPMKTWRSDNGEQIWNSYVENGTPHRLTSTNGEMGEPVFHPAHPLM